MNIRLECVLGEFKVFFSRFFFKIFFQNFSFSKFFFFLIFFFFKIVFSEVHCPLCERWLSILSRPQFPDFLVLFLSANHRQLWKRVAWAVEMWFSRKAFSVCWSWQDATEKPTPNVVASTVDSQDAISGHMLLRLSMPNQQADLVFNWMTLKRKSRCYQHYLWCSSNIETHLMATSDTQIAVPHSAKPMLQIHT